MFGIGELESKQESKTLEWNIPNFVSLGDETVISSPFTFANHTWNLSTRLEEAVWTAHYLSVSLSLNCETQRLFPGPDVILSFSIKKSDGSLTETQTVTTSQFCSCPVLAFPILLVDKMNLLPNILTIVCNLKCGQNLNGEEASTPVQIAASLNENSAVQALEHAPLTGNNGQINF